VRIGVVRDTVSDALAAERLPRANRVAFFDVGRLHDALARDELDAYIGSEPGPRLVVSRHPRGLRELPGPPLRVTEQAMAVAPGSPALAAGLDAWIAARSRDGWLAEVRRHWFQTLAWLE
jgi:ABC-type amino acid transport substrate-binding protein